MLDDDFLKERQNIRQKMLKFSRAINQGKPLDEDLKKEITSDEILRRRFKKHSPFFEENQGQDQAKKSNIYLKEDLINVRLEERQSLIKKFFFKMSLKNKAQRTKKSRKKAHFAKERVTQGKNPTPIQPKQEAYTQADIRKSLHNLQKKIIEQDQEHKQVGYDEDAQRAKNVLLDGFSDATQEDRNLNFNHLLFIILFVSFTLFLFIPQIYIRNQIYYLSREIATLRAKENVLNEENKDLKRRLESMRFQNQILDYLE